MSFDKALITPRLGCLNDILNNKNAFLYNSNENGELTDTLKKILNERVKLIEMGKYNKNDFKKYIS